MAAEEENKKLDPESVGTDPQTDDSTVPDKSKVESVTSFSLLDADTDIRTPKNATSGKQEDVEPDKEFITEVVQDEPKVETKTSQDTVLSDDDNKNISSEEVKDWLKDVRPDITKEQEKGGGSPIFKWLAVLVILLMVGGAIAGGIYYYRQNVPQTEESEQEGQEPPAEEQPQEEPTVTPTPEEVDLSIYSVSVLNGSGVAGEAGKIADLLEEGGFSNPNAANADSQDFTDTIVEHKETVPQSVIDEVVSSLEENYTIEVSGDLIAEDGDYDIVVTVGEQNE